MGNFTNQPVNLDKTTFKYLDENFSLKEIIPNYSQDTVARQAAAVRVLNQLDQTNDQV